MESVLSRLKDLTPEELAELRRILADEPEGDEGGSAPVREPRRPRRPSAGGAVALDDPLEDHVELSVRSSNVLRREGVVRVGQLLALEDVQIGDLYGVGAKAKAELVGARESLFGLLADEAERGYDLEPREVANLRGRRHPGEGRRNDDALYASRPLTDGERMAIGDWGGISQGRGDSMG